MKPVMLRIPYLFWNLIRHQTHGYMTQLRDLLPWTLTASKTNGWKEAHPYFQTDERETSPSTTSLQPLYPPVLAAEWLAGRGPVLSVHSTQPAACSTPPRPRCSPAGPPLWMLLPQLLQELQLLSRGQSHLPGLEVTDERDMTRLTTTLMLT